MEKLMNVENKWSDSTDASKVEGAMRRIEVEEGPRAMNRSNGNWENRWAF